MSLACASTILLMSFVPAVAFGQTAPAPVPAAATPPVTATPAADAPSGPATWAGTLDFGLRGTSTNGDAARYERYRDLGDGLFLDVVRLHKEHAGWLLDIGADHVARRDQRYTGEVVRPGRLRAILLWDQIPMLLSRTTRTLYAGIGTGALTIDDGIQRQVETNPAALTGLFNQFGQTFETSTRRHIGSGGVEYQATSALSLTASVRHANREGTIPYGGSFGHSSVVELPAPTDHDLSEVDAGAEYVRNPLLLRAGYTGSWFHNEHTSLTFDNPYRLTDTVAAPATGRLSLAPSSSMIGVNGMISAKLPYRSRATAYGSIGMLQDAGDPILPQTINPAFTTAPLDRTTVDGEARTSALNLTFVSRPVRYLDLNLRYQTYDYDNRTPEFALTERVAFDNTPAAVSPALFTEPYGVDRHTLDADVRFAPTGRTSAGIGVTRLSEARSHRIFSSTTDKVVRLTFDTMSRSWLTLRTKYEHGQRRGDGIEEGELELAAIGEQPSLRHFDIASRNRDRVTIMAAVIPASSLSANVSVAAGKDDYLESVFGLRDNTHRVYGAGADYVASNLVTLGVSYSYENYHALSRSRQANPGVQFTDPSRDWATDSSDTTHSLTLNADLARIARKLDLHLGYDASRARAHYDYRTGPVADRTLPEEVSVPTTLPTPTALPPTISDLDRGSADALYVLTSRLSVGVSYGYERYRVQDFTLDIDANPDLVRGQALLIGYLYRPYTANTVWGRLVYRW